MKAAVITFPGSNCDRDLAVALETATGRPTTMLWHKDAALPDGLDLVALPGGFSFGDYLRCGAIAARSPVMQAVVAFARRGGHVLGICNGFQVLVESGLLPGVLMRNANLDFVCRDVVLTVETTYSPFTSAFQMRQTIRIPVAHHDGNYVAGPEVVAKLKDDDRVAFRYGEAVNGSTDGIAGILSQNRRILGMMPHPERASDADLGSKQGFPLFQSLVQALVAA